MNKHQHKQLPVLLPPGTRATKGGAPSDSKTYDGLWDGSGDGAGDGYGQLDVELYLGAEERALSWCLRGWVVSEAMWDTLKLG